MTDTQINTFLVVAKAGSIAHASEIMFVSPPAISKQLSSLEKNLGVILFERSRIGVRFTPGGKMLYDFYTRINAEFKNILELARQANEKSRCLLRVGCREEWNVSTFFPEAVQKLSEEDSSVDVTLDILREEEMLSQLLGANLDFLILPGDSVRKKKDLVCRTIATIRGGLLYSARHHLADKKDLSLTDFRNEKFFIIAEAKSPETIKRLSLKVLDRCNTKGFQPVIAVVPSVASAYSKIRNNQGVLFVAEWSMARSDPAYKFMFLDIAIDVSACWLNDSKNDIKNRLYEKLVLVIAAC